MKKLKKDDTTTINREALKKVLKVRKKRQIDVAEHLKINIDYFRRCLQYGEIKDYYLTDIAEYLDVHPNLLKSDFITDEHNYQPTTFFPHGTTVTDELLDLNKVYLEDLMCVYDFKSYQCEKFDYYNLINTILYLTTGYKITAENPIFTKEQYDIIISNMLDNIHKTIHTFKLKLPTNFYLINYAFKRFPKTADFFREKTIDELKQDITEIKELQKFADTNKINISSIILKEIEDLEDEIKNLAKEK